MIIRLSGIHFIVVMVLIGTAKGQVADRSRISSYLDRLAESRSDIKTYTVVMSGTTFKRNSLTTSSKEAFKSVVSVRAEIACDMLQDKCILIVKHTPFLPGTTYYPSLPANDSRVFLINGIAVSLLDSKGRFVDLGDPQRIPVPDPLSLGTGFCSESTRFLRFSKSLSQLYSWESTGMRVRSAGGLITFHDAWQEVPKAYSSSITFDPARGGLVREIVHVPDPGKVDYIRGEVEPVKVDEHWVPKRVAYTCGANGLFFNWDLDWISINEPIPEDVFDPETVLELLGGT